MIVLVSLGFFSALALNLLLHFGLGLRGAAAEEDSSLPFLQTGLLFLSVLILWIFFSYALIPLGLGFLEYPALFPLGALVSCGLERLFSRFFLSARFGSRLFRPLTAYEGLVMAALVITLDTASSLAEALVLSLGFSLGLLFSLLLLQEIRLRSALERIPPFLRGSPLILISMGLLSLVFTSAAAVLFKILALY